MFEGSQLSVKWSYHLIYNDTWNRNETPKSYKQNPFTGLKLRLIDVDCFAMIFCVFLSGEEHEDAGKNEHDEGSADATCIRYECLNLTIGQNYDEHGNRQNDTPDSLHWVLVIIQQPQALSGAFDPLFDWKHVEQVVSQRDVEDWHGCEVQHGVEVAELTDSWQI